MKCTTLPLETFFRMTAFLLVSLLVLALFCIPTVHAVANDKIHYQGKLYTSAGSPVTDGSHTMRFRFYDVASGGSALWDETQTISTTGGLFTVLLGSVTSLSGMNWNQSLYLGVTVDADTEMTPRHTIGAVPAAHTIVGTLGVAQGGTGTSTQFATGTVLFAGVNGTYSGNANQLFISSSTGNLGIGTISPLSKLEVSGIGQTTTALTDAGVRTGNIAVNVTDGAVGSGGAITFGSAQSVAAGSLGWAAIKGMLVDGGGNTRGDLAFSTRSATTSTALTERMRIMSDGNVGIGTSSPSAKIDIYGTAGSADILALSSSSNARLFTVTEAGNVGIGTSTPTAQLHTTGSVRFQTFGAGSLSTDANGNLTVSSDERLKDITGSFDTGLAAIRGLEPIRYRWNAESGLEQEVIYAGFSAQNVMNSIEDAVGVDKRGYYTLNDRPIIAASVNAIKELDVTLESLASTTMATTTEDGTETFVGRFLHRLVTWFADATNGIGNFFAKSFRAKDTICVGNTCISEVELEELLANAGITSSSSNYSSSAVVTTESETATIDTATGAEETASSTEEVATSTDSTVATTTEPVADSATASSTDTVADTEAPVITMNGEASVTLQINGDYTDAGATVTDNVDTDILVSTESNVDTSATSTYSVIYTAEDKAGNKATATRTVIVE